MPEGRTEMNYGLYIGISPRLTFSTDCPTPNDAFIQYDL